MSGGVLSAKGGHKAVPAKVKKVMRDAEQENPRLCVIFGDMEENYEEE